MLTLAWYLLKVMICSGILFGYYWLALRNKIFHRWNRFYLLTVVVLSITLPLIKINVWQRSDEPKTQVVQLLQVISTGDEIVFDYNSKGGLRIDSSSLAWMTYILG